MAREIIKEEVTQRLYDLYKTNNDTELAALMGVNGKTLHNYISGRSAYSSRILNPVCTAKNVKLDWLLYGEEEKKTDDPFIVEIKEIVSRKPLSDETKRIILAAIKGFALEHIKPDPPDEPK